MNNRRAFIDFVQGLLHLDPIARWSPQQARLHPFITGEPFTKSFVPPFATKSQAKASQVAATVDAKRPYGGLPAAAPRSAARTYPDAAAYNQHLAQQQAYAAVNSANAYRASQVPTNPYMDPPAVPVQRTQQAAVSGQAIAPQQAYPTYGPTTMSSSLSKGSAVPQATMVTNPPAVHHYPTRGRAMTISQLDNVPPQLQRLGVDLTSIAGQSMTPVLRRDDQREAWERRQEVDNGLSRKISVNRQHPALDLLTRQAEYGYSVGHPHLQQSMYPAYSQQHHSALLPPPAAALTSSRGLTSGSIHGNPYDSFDNEANAAYSPVQASPRQNQASYYSNPFPNLSGNQQNQAAAYAAQQAALDSKKLSKKQSRDLMQNWP